MENKSQSTNRTMTLEEGQNEANEIIKLIEEIAIPYTYKVAGANSLLPPDFSFKFWYVIPVAIVPIWGVKALEPELNYVTIINWLGPMLALGFITGIGLLAIVTGVWFTGRIFRFIRGSRNNVVAVRNEKISDTDLIRLSKNQFIKQWLIDALKKHDRLTYSLLYKDRYKISHNVTAEIVVAEKKRIRTLINDNN